MNAIILVITFVASVALFYFFGIHSHFWHYLLGMAGGSAIVWGILMSANG